MPCDYLLLVLFLPDYPHIGESCENTFPSAICKYAVVGSVFGSSSYKGKLNKKLFQFAMYMCTHDEWLEATSSTKFRARVHGKSLTCQRDSLNTFEKFPEHVRKVPWLYSISLNTSEKSFICNYRHKNSKINGSVHRFGSNFVFWVYS